MHDKDKHCYTFYAYKPYSSSRSYGEYDSDYVFEYEQTYAQVVEHWARCLLRNQDLAYKEAGWREFVVLKNGRSLGGMMNDNETDFYDCEAFGREIKEMEQEADNLATTWYNEAKQREADAATTQARKIAEEDTAIRRATYEALKKEFEP